MRMDCIEGQRLKAHLAWMKLMRDIDNYINLLIKAHEQSNRKD
jgi:hypothetical protein